MFGDIYEFIYMCLCVQKDDTKHKFANSLVNLRRIATQLGQNGIY